MVRFFSIALLLSACVFGFSFYTIYRGEPGIDVSHHNTIRWSSVAKHEDVRFAFVKITEGSTFVDPCGRRNVLCSEEEGIRVGVYHYFSTRSSAQAQFNNFKTHFVKASTLVPMVDVEDTDGISSAELSGRLMDFCRLVEKEYGKKPVIYTRPDLYYSVFVLHNLSFWRDYTFFFWQPIPIHPVFSTGRLRCIWQYSTSMYRMKDCSIVDLDVLSGISLSSLLR